MTNQQLRLLYLSNAFPPGVTGRFPSLNPAGHATETRMIQALSQQTRMVTVGLLPGGVWGKLEPRDDSFGWEHELLLWQRKPELWHRWRSWRQLRRFYLERTAREGGFDVVLVRNLSPIFNHFIRWLRRQRPRPLIALVLADSGQLGEKISIARRLRYRLKPMQTLDGEAILRYDACISFGIDTKRYFESRGVPWLWMPSAFNFRYDPPPADPAPGQPIRFGYFGSLAEHACIIPLVRTFLDLRLPGTLHVCGHGGSSETLKNLAASHPHFHFDGLLPRASDCLAWAQQVDVLINPRLPWEGAENSFPSKLFEFAMTGKAVLSTRTGGVDQVLGEEGLYLDTDNFEADLRWKLGEVAAMDRAELQRRGTAIRCRVLKDFNWEAQTRRMVEFLTGIMNAPPVFLLDDLGHTRFNESFNGHE